MKKNIDLLITHKNCPDGLGCAIATKAWHVENGYDVPEIVFVQYGDAVPDCTGKVVLMADFSFDLPTIEKMHGDSEYLYILDHHKTSEETLKTVSDDYATFDSSKSGAVLTWEYFYGDREVPKILLYIQDRDLWKWELTNSKEFSAGFRLYDWDSLNRMNLNDILTTSFISDCIKYGTSVLKYQNQIIDGVMKNKNKFRLSC